MNVTLPLSPFLESFIQDSVAAGRFQSVEHLVLTALNLLQDRERRIAANMDGLLRELRQSAAQRRAELATSGSST